MKKSWFEKFNSFSLAFFALVVLSGVILIGGIASADTDSEVSVIPNITAGGIDDQPFEATVTAGEGHTVHEFRVYESGDFNDLKCNAKANWNGPYYGNTTFGRFCLWTAYLGHEINPGDTDYFYFTMDSPDTECCRVMRTEPRDLEQSWQPKNIDICVDKTPPETTKTYGDPHYPPGINQGDPYPHWITTDTSITLTPTDCPGGCNRETGPHDAGIDKTWYIDFLVPDFYCEFPGEECQPICDQFYDGDANEACIENCQIDCEKDLGIFDSWEDCVENCVDNFCGINCQPYRDLQFLAAQVLPPSYTWQLYTEPFYKEEESCHLLQYFSVDGVGNVEDMNHQCVFVDDTPPEPIKEVGDPKIPMPPYDEFQTIGEGTAEWTDLDSKFGDYSARLYVKNGGSDIAAIEFDVDVALEDISELSFWQKISNTYGVNVILGVDADGDGVYESQDKPWHFSHDPSDLGDDSFIEMDGMSPSSGSWEKVDTLLISQWWTPNNAGDGFCPGFGWNPLSDFQSSTACRIEPSDRVKVIRLLIGGSGSWMDKVAFVDDIKLNGKTIILEPKNWWVRDHVTPITLECIDPEPHPVDHEQVCFLISFDDCQTEDNCVFPRGDGQYGFITKKYCDYYKGEMGKDGVTCCIDSPFTFNFTEDSLHDLEFYCKDALGNEGPEPPEFEWFRVDSQPPIIKKTMTGPQVGDCPPEAGEDCWIKDWKYADGTKIHVEAEDDEKYGCAVDEVVCQWWYFRDGEGPFYVADSTIKEGKSKWITPPFDIKFYDETEHELHIECCDALGNCDDDVETFYVDSSGPKVKKEFIGPFHKEGDVEWIDTATTINLTATDKPSAPCAVGEENIYYINTLAGSDEPCLNIEKCKAIHQPNPTGDGWTKYAGPFPKADESCHILEYYAVDKLGNVGPVGVNCFFVDKTKPEVYAETGEPKIECDPQDPSGCDYWVRDHVTEITLGCRYGKNEPHPAPLDKIEWRIKVDDKPWGEWQEADADTEVNFVFTEDSVHTLEYKCNDTVGKESNTLTKIYRVDSTPPTTTKTIIPDPYIDPKTGAEYIDTAHVIELTAEDGGDICAVGVDKTWYKNIIIVRGEGQLACSNPEEYCKVPEDFDYCDNCDDGQYPYECMEIVQNWCTDNWDNPGSYTSWHDCVERRANMECCGGWNWELYSGPIQKQNESCHILYYFSVDDLGNVEDIQVNCFFVDKEPPEIIKELGVPFYEGPECDNNDFLELKGGGPGAIWTTNGDCGDETQDENEYAVGETVYINGAGFDPDEYDWEIRGKPGQASCDPNEVVTGGKYTVNESGSFCEPAYVVQDGDCGVYGVDFGGKKDNYHVKGTATVSECAEWISFETPVHIDTYDPEPHPSGVDTVHYRITLVDDVNCWYDEFCQEAEGSGLWVASTEEFEFNIEQESCHLIEIRAVDNVGKESMHKQCVFVEDTGPEPIKTVLDPKEKWDGSDSMYYPGIEDLCWNNQSDELECWKVTTLTPIVMDCVDPEPHPVDHERLCFNVNFDGEEYTQHHCVEPWPNSDTPRDVVYNLTGRDMAWCCYEWDEYNIEDKNHEQSAVWIWFSEESEHELEFFCEDALGNKGDLDVEKFKVEGTAFEIPIFKKWNLISVPFQLLNPDPEEVFKNISGDIEAVWTYDGETDTWYVYTPDGIDNDNLESIEPGWGYWVLGKEDITWLKIGGSLFKPGPYVPVERFLKMGWNLIGYYGTEWQEYEILEDDLCDYGRDLPFGNIVYNSLYSLMEEVFVLDPEAYFLELRDEWAKPNWRSLWTYQTCGVAVPPDDQPYWLPLDYDNMMYPGYGFWIHMNSDDYYAPSFKMLGDDHCFPFCS